MNYMHHIHISHTISPDLQNRVRRLPTRDERATTGRLVVSHYAVCGQATHSTEASSPDPIQEQNDCAMSLSPVDPKIKGNTDSNSNRPPTPVNLVQPKHQQHNTCARSGPKAETEALIPLMDHVAAYGESKNFFYSTPASTRRKPGPCSGD